MGNDMPCILIEQTPINVQRQQEALDRLRKALARGKATVVIGRDGAIAFKGWDGEGVLFDVCAFRKLRASNSPELRRAIAKAEARSGRKVNERAIASGVHSHDGGNTWGTH
jgi:hypothetical protein